MGLEWLTQIKQALVNAGFRVEAGYPAHKAVCLTQTAAAVNLKGMDEKEVREVLVTVLTPRSLGLEQCQSKAAEGIRALASDGNQWSFSGWRYEEGIDCWVIEICGIPAQTEQAEQPAQPEGCAVWIGETEQKYVTDFLAQQTPDRRLIRPHGEGVPSGVTPGKQGWNLTLTQLLPVGEPEPEAGAEPFSLTVSRGSISQVYGACWWSGYSSRQTAEGTQVVRSAFALSREVSAGG